MAPLDRTAEARPGWTVSPTRAIAGAVAGGRRAVPLTVLLGTMVAAHSLLETARDSLFLAGQPIGRLPWLYLAATVVVLPVTQLQALAGRRRGGSGALLATLLGSAITTLGFWATADGSRGVGALYVWAALFSSIAFVQFWLVAVESFEVTEAKQVFCFIAAGGLLGAVAGHALARLALVAAAPRTLLLISAALMIGAAGLLRVITAPRSRAAAQDLEVPVLGALPHHLHADRYFRLLVLLALLSALCAIFIDFLFKATVAAHTTRAQIPATVATAYLVQSAVALGVELLVARLLLRKTGVTRTLLLLPFGLLAVGAGFLVAGGLVLALALKVVDAGLRPSLNRVGTELLYLPVSPAHRRLLKPSIDALGQRGGQALGSLALLALLPLTRATAWVSGALLATTLGWIWVVHALRPLYLRRFEAQLGGGRTLVHPPQLDLASAEVLVSALGSPDAGQVLASLELLAGGGRLGLIPALILYHSDPVVVRAALEILATAGRPDVAAMLPALLRHADPEVRAAAARRWLASGQHAAPLRSLVTTDPHPCVRSAALVALGAVPGSRAELETMATIVRVGTSEERRELARAIADSPREALAPLLARLFESGEVIVRKEVLRAAQQLPLPRRVLPELVGLLPDCELREGARAALVAIGTPALEHLGDRLLDATTPFRLDRELPAAVAEFPPGAAAPFLLRRIGEPRGGTSRFRSFRALNRMRQRDPALELDRAVLERTLSIELATAHRNRETRLQAMDLGYSDRSGGAGAMLLDVLRSKETLAVERVFRVLQLLFPEQGLHRVYLGTRSGRTAVRGAATEVLVELLPSPSREKLLGLLADEAPSRRGVAPAAHERQRFIVGLLRSSSPMVRLLAACVAAESGSVEVLPALRVAAGELADEVDRQVLLSVIDRLEGGAAHAHG